MRSNVRLQIEPRRPPSSAPARTRMAAAGLDHPMLPADAREVEQSSHLAPGSPFDHALRQAPVHATTPVTVQHKLTIGTAGDAHEREADRVAEQVMRIPEPPAVAGDGQGLSGSYAPPDPQRLSRKCTACEAEEDPVVQRSPAPDDPEELPILGPRGTAPEAPDVLPVIVEAPRSHTRADEEDEADQAPIEAKHADGAAPIPPPAVGARVQATRGGGVPLPEPHRAFFETRFGCDFSHVSIHADATANALSRALGARAFTTGRDIYFRDGEYRPWSWSGRALLAHELAHVVQQSGGAVQRKVSAHWYGSGIHPLIQRKDDKEEVVYYRYQVRVPESYTTLDQMYRLFERTAFGREVHLGWNCRDFCDMEKNRGRIIGFLVQRSAVERLTDPAAEEQRRLEEERYEKLPAKKRQALNEEADRRYYEHTGVKRGTRIRKDDTGGARLWKQKLGEVLEEQNELEKLPPAVRELMLGKSGTFEPRDHEKLLRIARKLEQFRAEDFAVYKLLTLRATDDLDLFERSVDMYLARKEELQKALVAQQQPGAQAEPTLQDSIAERWKGFDAASLGKMSEADRQALARRMTSELTEAQLKYMMAHPGATAKDFAKSAALLTTPETFKGIGKDLAEAAKGDANAWARWAAGVGAGAKLSGWLLAVAGVLYVASWLTGVGEVATIAAAAGILLGSTLTLSLVESELRIKAASQATTPEEFKRNVEAAAAARANVIAGVALIVVAAVLHFTAKALFPETVKKIQTSLKNLRERIRLRGSVHEIKPGVLKEVAARREELVRSTERAKGKVLETAKELEGTTTEQFVDKVEGGDTGFFDQSKVPPEQKVDFRALLETPEGRTAIDAYKQKLIAALNTDVIAEIERLAREHTSRIDEFTKEVEAARNHDELSAAADKLERALSEERLKDFMRGEQERMTREKTEEAAREAHEEVLRATRDAIITRVTRRIAAQPDKFRLTYSEAELDAIFGKGKELGLGDRLIEDMIYTGSRVAKAISAADLMQQMENWAKVVSMRKFPYKFDNLAQFQQFGRDLLEAVREAGLPVDDVRVQGSALRKPTADDVDLAVFVDEATFDKLLIDRYDGRAAFSGKATATPNAKLLLRGKSHAELLELAREIMAKPEDYNNQAQTFGHAMKNGIISSTHDIFKPLKAARSKIAEKYPTLNIKTISVQIKGGAFDMLPEMRIHGN